MTTPYDRLAADYDRRWAMYNQRSLALLRPLVEGRAMGRVLDLGCGTANLVPRLEAWAASIRRYSGVDPSREMVLAARPKLAASRTPATLAVAEAGALPFAEARFDSVVCASVLHDLREPARALAEARRVLRPGGRLLLVDWSRQRWTMKAMSLYLRLLGDAFQRMYSMDEAGALLRDAGFRVLRGERRAITGLWELMVIEAEAA